MDNQRVHIDSQESDDEPDIDDELDPDYDPADDQMEDDEEELQRVRAAVGDEDLEALRDAEWNDDDYVLVEPQLLEHNRLRARDQGDASPFACFSHLIPLNFYDTLATHMMAYARIKYNEEDFQINAAEVMAFLAVIFWMGVHDLPRLDYYWHSNGAPLFIRRLFPERRFLAVLRYFHISHPEREREQAANPFAKLEPLASTLRRNFSTHAVVAREMAIDESMIRFKGRHRLKQYMRAKPIRWGFKAWVIASDQFVLDFEIYAGRRADVSPAGPIHDVVIRLATPFAHEGRVLFLDNLFVTPSLFDELHAMGIRACGPVRSNRAGLPRLLLAEAERLRRGQSWWRHRGVLGLTLFMDRSLVCLLHTHMNANPRDPAVLARRAQDEVPLDRPVPIHDYNLHRGDVDMINQLHIYSPPYRKSKRWWVPVAWWLLDIALINTKRIHRQETDELLTTRQFRALLVREMLESARDRGFQPMRGHAVHIPGAMDNHFLRSIRRQRDCSMCSNRPIHRVRTSYECAICEVPLCVDGCFARYHGYIDDT